MELHHPSSRAGKLKYLSHHTQIEKISSVYTQKPQYSTPRAQSLADTKKQSTYFAVQKSSKHAKPRIETEPRGPRTPNSLNLITNFMSESKSQEVRLLKAEVSMLKNSLNSLTTELHELKQSYNKNLDILIEERDNYKSELVNLIQKCFNSNEIDQKFKINLKNSLEVSEKLRDLNFEKVFNDVLGENEKKLFDVEKTVDKDLGTARFRSLNEEQMVYVLKNFGEAIVLEDFSGGGVGWLQVKAGDRVEVIGKSDDDAWVVSFNNQVGRIPTKVLLND